MVDTMTASPLMDVVVPTLGRKSSLGRTVRGLLRQPNVSRVIVVASGPWHSSDAVDVVEEWDRVKLIRSASQLFAGAARNLGATFAETDILGFCDDDDIWTRPVGALLADAASSCGVAAGTLHRLTADGKCGRVWAFSDEINQRRVHYWNPGVTGSNLVLTRRIFEESGRWSEVLPSMNDIEFLTRLTRIAPIPVVREAAVLLDLSHAERLGVQRQRPLEDLRQLLREPLAARGATQLDMEARLQLARYERRLARQLLHHPFRISAAGRLIMHALRTRVPYGELNRGCGEHHGHELNESLPISRQPQMPDAPL